MFKHCAVLSLLMLFSMLAASAQTPDTATVRGVVTDQSHAVVADAQVHVINSLTKLDRVATSGKDGSFAIAGLPIAGDYDVT
jgi:type 1 fimbria pilin